MSKTFQPLFPAVGRQASALGERLRLARRRRRITLVQYAERLGVTRVTAARLERGDPNVSLGTYLRALRVLGLDRDIEAVAADDELGRKLQDLELTPRKARDAVTGALDG